MTGWKLFTPSVQERPDEASKNGLPGFKGSSFKSARIRKRIIGRWQNDLHSPPSAREGVKTGNFQSFFFQDSGDKPYFMISGREFNPLFFPKFNCPWMQGDAYFCSYRKIRSCIFPEIDHFIQHFFVLWILGGAEDIIDHVVLVSSPGRSNRCCRSRLSSAYPRLHRGPCWAGWGRLSDKAIRVRSFSLPLIVGSTTRIGTERETSRTAGEI